MQTEKPLELRLNKSAEHGYRMIEFIHLRHELFDLGQPAETVREPDIDIGVAKGPSADGDVPSVDPNRVMAGMALLRDAAHGKHDHTAVQARQGNTANAIRAFVEAQWHEARTRKTILETA